jgi:hypothetical protein
VRVRLIVSRHHKPHGISSEDATQGFLERCGASRWAVPNPTPSFLAIARHEDPDARRLLIWDSRMWTRGRPSFFPLARALRKPALTRSTIRLRSSSATAPKTVKIIFPVGVLVSMFSERDTKSIPRASTKASTDENSPRACLLDFGQAHNSPLSCSLADPYLIRDLRPGASLRAEAGNL